jgi:hypothetical protein
LRTKICCCLASTALALLLASPALLTAQTAPPASSPAIGSQADPAQVYSSILDGISQEIVSIAQAMPAEKYDYAPTNGKFDGVRTFGGQLKHLAQENYFFYGKFGVTPNADPKAIDKLTGKDEIIKAYQDAVAFAHQAIGTITPQNAFQVLDARQSTRAGMATRAMADANDHYGQLVEYLRANGMAPPVNSK